MYCQTGEKPIIEYSFGQGSVRKFKSDFAPIDVSSKPAPVESSDNFNSQGYQLNFYSTNNFRDLSIIVKDYKIAISDNPDNSVIRYMNCGETKFQPGVNFRPSTLIVNPNIKCPSPSKNRCSIEVKHKGIIIFQDQGDCPCNFKVQCGDCPEGYIKCQKPLYPGYCCISCSEIRGGIASITTTLRNINNG